MSKELSEHYISDILQGFEKAFEQHDPLFIENAPFHDYTHPQGHGLYRRSMEDMLFEAIDRLSFSYGMSNFDVTKDKQPNLIQTRKQMGVAVVSFEQIGQINSQMIERFQKYERGLIVLDMEGYGAPQTLNVAWGVISEKRIGSLTKSNAIDIPAHVQMCVLMDGPDLKRSLTLLKNRGVVVQNHHRPNHTEDMDLSAEEHAFVNSTPSLQISEQHHRQVQNAGNGWLNRLLTTRQQKGLDDPTQPDRPLFKQS